MQAFPLSRASSIDHAWKGSLGTRLKVEQGYLKPYESSFVLLRLDDFS